MASFTFTGSAVQAGTSGTYSPKNVYTSLDRVRDYLALGSQHTSDNDTLKRFIYSASRAIDRQTHRYFYPNRKTRYLDLPKDLGVLRFDEDLLEVMGLSAINGASEVDSSVYWPKQGGDWNDTPYDRIEIKDDSGSLFNYSGTEQRAVHLDGIWGYREDYDSEGWVDTGASLTGSITATALTLNLSGSAGEDTNGYAPRLWEDQLLKIDSEFLRVVRGDSSSQIRVMRGVNGTTAASHASAIAVYGWAVQDDIEYACRQLTVYQYIKSIDPTTERVAVPTMGGFSIAAPSTWPPEVKETLEHYRKQRVYTITVED